MNAAIIQSVSISYLRISKSLPSTTKEQSDLLLFQIAKE